MKAKRKEIILAALAIVAVVCVYLIIVLSFWFYGKEKIYPNVSIAGINVSNMEDAEAEYIINSKINEYLSNGINFSNRKLDLEKLELKYDIKDSIEKSKKETSKNPFLLGFKKDNKLEFTYNKEYIYSFVFGLEKDYSLRPQNSQITIEAGKMIVSSGKDGQQINYTETIYDFNQALASLNKDTDPSLLKIPPVFTKEDLENRINEIEKIFENGLALKYPSGRKSVPLEEMVKWVELESSKISDVEIFAGDDLFSPFYAKDSERQILSTNYIENYLGKISKDLNIEPVNAQLTMSDGKVIIFKDSKDGRSLDISNSAKLIKEGLESGNIEIGLVFNIVKPDVYLGSLNELGINELIATGYSNFSGSPSSRRHNIRVGASKFNGLLIKPGENFSFTVNLGEVDVANGYLPELVIKNNETTPEFGGGLCQVSSTAFRAAMNAGLPIVVRKAHSYPVSYYKPYGTDATIYIPSPDLKFKNDTKEHILIQTRIVGNYLYFDFYGTKKDISVKFAGNKEANGSVSAIEKVTPYTYDHGGRGNGSFKAIIYRFIYDSNNKLINSESFLSNYDSPDKYPQ